MSDRGGILICTADGALGSAVAARLTSAGYIAGLAATQSQALRLACALRLRCAVVDLVLPDGSAADVLAALRALPLLADLPAVVLAPFGVPIHDPAVPSVARLLHKPLDLTTLARAVDEVLQPSDAVPAPAGLALDLRSLSARWGSRTVILTPTEMKLLAFLLERRGHTVSLPELLAAVWATPHVAGGPELVRVHIRNLRTKLAVLTDNPEDIIRTVPRQGYLVPSEVPVAVSEQRPVL